MIRHLKTVEKFVKNKFRWQWLETTVEIMLKGERKSIPLIEWIRKIHSYGARGRVSLIQHSNSNEHAEKLKLKDSNYPFGLSKANSKFYA